MGAIGLIIINEPISSTYLILFKGGFGSSYAIISTLVRATPIMLCGIAIALSWRSGFENLGSEGQMIIGAMVAAIVGVYMPGPSFIVTIIAILAAMVAGGLYAYLAVLLEKQYKVQILISTLMMNYIAVHFTSYLVSFPLRDNTGIAGLSQTYRISEGVQLPKLLQGYNLHFGLIIAIILVILLYIFTEKSVLGYETKMIGSNPFFAIYGGINRSKMMLLAMLISGAISGFAGAGEVLGMQQRYIDGMLKAPSYAWTGLMAAMLSGNNIIATAIASLVLAGLQVGAMALERRTNVPYEISSIIQAIITLCVAAKITFPAIKMKIKNRGEEKQVG